MDRACSTHERDQKCVHDSGLKASGKRPLVRPRRRWKGNIKMDLTEIGWESMDWIHLYQNRDQWRALVGTVMNLRVQ
jgi:hypothetical protein